MFPSVFLGNDVVGGLISPKRGRNLLSKNAITGNVPVIGGGLEPTTYHNQSNTKPPVLTISASGANAGFVRLWHIPVWASDSSYIDNTLTDYVYFWYVFLKMRQKEIFESQTGSAQPHIYPKHIANLSISKISENMIKKYNNTVEPLFDRVGNNSREKNELAVLRDTLLPKLMSGEIDVSKVDI